MAEDGMDEQGQTPLSSNDSDVGELDYYNDYQDYNAYDNDIGSGSNTGATDQDNNKNNQKKKSGKWESLKEEFASWTPTSDDDEGANNNSDDGNDDNRYDECKVPVSFEQLYTIFLTLTQKFGFQKDNMENMYHHLLTQLDSRASRMSCSMALISLHSNYIGGEQANYKKWYFSCQLDLDEEFGFNNIKLHGSAMKRNLKIAKKNGTDLKKNLKNLKMMEKNNGKIEMVKEDNNISNKSDIKMSKLKNANYKWKLKMKSLSLIQMARQIALYLLCWGEANNIRYAPECLCFIFKCCLDYDEYTESQLQLQRDDIKKNKPSEKIQIKKDEYTYLNNVITPIYTFLRDQRYEKSENRKQKLIKNTKDHQNVIGYDDVNQLFWYPEGIEKIVLKNGARLVDKPFNQRYLYLQEIQWEKVFYKTYKEKRSWMHCCLNFNRIWIIHFTSFWYFTSFNSPTLYTKNYNQQLNNGPILQVRLTVFSFAGSIACIVQLLATLMEVSFVPRTWPGAQYLWKRFLGLVLLLLVNFAPTVYILGWYELDQVSQTCLILSIVQFCISLLTCIFFSIRPLGGLFRSYLKKDKHKRRYVSSQTFTASFPKLTGRPKFFSYGLWFSVFLCKFIESYFFLTLSLRDPIRVLSILDMSRCKGDAFVPAKWVCHLQPKVTLCLMIFTDLILFFLDTYLWYIVCNCFFSIGLSFSLGTSILTPWKNIYSRLPKRIFSKVIATNQLKMQSQPVMLVSQIWNAIIISLFREHLLDISHVNKLIYQKVHYYEIINQNNISLKSPSFFVAEDDSTFKSTEYFVKNSEAQRRLSFFAQSLSTPINEPIPVEWMPTFTVLVPHYSEKILLTLREVIMQEDPNTKLTLLEYLKHLYPHEWEYFVKDTKILAYAFGYLKNPEKQTEKDPNSKMKNENYIQNNIDDLPFYSIGFNSSSEEFKLRTCIWASLRCQTLYRTVSGFQNYSRAIKLLYRIETPWIMQTHGDDIEALDTELEKMANRKFKMIVAMQRYATFSEDELKATEFMLETFPHMKISYLEEVANETTHEVEYFSCLIDGFCEKLENSGKRKPLYRIKLSGNPILGDGKSDNQNHSIVFYRGEYIQVIDANQDNYYEECLKIRSVLSEFEELSVENVLPYIPELEYKNEEAPVAIVGAREYIFSENIGVLGDIAAGKEQTFGTLFARTLAEIGGKLHYGHPDFLNAIFMTTRGGISKAQKGLHLNEDIYAGMTAVCRGGRIKHSDYYQCGKGRDLGFGSILNFTSKIGAGMGEQLLSREYYYLGTQLPLDRFLSFFYAHPGFHLNNLFISLSVQLFFVLLLNLGAMNHELVSCFYNKDAPITDLERPLGCYNMKPVLNWVTIFVLSIFIVFFIAFCPLLIQEILERGIWKSFSRFFHHLTSFAPIFEVFVCQIYSNALITDMSFGSAKYISTGRGFAISRVAFPELYSKFATSSIYTGAKNFLMLLFALISMWQPALLWFVITLLSLTSAPFVFNPHQFSFKEFFIDYKKLMQWFMLGNSNFVENSWSNYTKLMRARYCGFKKKMIGDVSENQPFETNVVSKCDMVLTEFIAPFFVCVFSLSAYLFVNSQTGVSGAEPTMSSVRLIIVTVLPILLNLVVLVLLFGISLFLGPVLSLVSPKFNTGVACICHFTSVLIYLLVFDLIFILEGFNVTRSLTLIITAISIQQFLFRVCTLFFMSKEFKNCNSNIAWWSGKWLTTRLGWAVVGQPLREFLVKVIESSYFAADFILSHALLFLQTPLVFTPFIDTFHSMVLYWLTPKQVVFKKVSFNIKANKQRNQTCRRYLVLYFVNTTLLLTFFLMPLVMNELGLQQEVLVFAEKQYKMGPLAISKLFQPNRQNNNDTGGRIAVEDVYNNTF
ncbi:1,3-beta-glucan synthase component fks3 [Hanseniaspora vineae]